MILITYKRWDDKSFLIVISCFLTQTKKKNGYMSSLIQLVVGLFF